MSNSAWTLTNLATFSNMIRTYNIYKKICNNVTDGQLLSSEQLSQLQEHLMWMYTELEKVCTKHGLQICLAFGNVLGAMRHNGWIPWDDDLDVHMPRKDYELLISKYASELPKSFKIYSSLNANGAISKFAKVIDTDTVFVSLTSEKDESSGVFIDIFPIDNIGTNKFINKIRKYWAYFLMYTATSVMQVEESSERYKSIMCTSKEGRKNFYFRQIWGTFFSFVSSQKWHKWIENFWKIKTDTGYVHAKHALCMCGKTIPYDLFFPITKKKIAIGVVSLPHEPIKYLDLIYGNWQKIPSDDDKWHHYVREFHIPATNDGGN